MPAVASQRLTRRQLEVLRLAALGKGDGEIGRELRITPTTVRQHLHGAYGRLGVTNRIEALIALGVLDPTRL